MDAQTQQLGLFEENEALTGASFSKCKKYRYALWRVWDKDMFGVMAAFIMFNPSVAGEIENDPTVRRCMSFAKRWGYSGIYIVNLFAYVTSDPADLDTVKDPIGPINDATLNELKLKGNNVDVIFAWGAKPKYIKRMKEVNRMFPHAKCIRLTKDGYPEHPLFLPGYLSPIDFEWKIEIQTKNNFSL